MTAKTTQNWSSGERDLGAGVKDPVTYAGRSLLALCMPHLLRTDLGDLTEALVRGEGATFDQKAAVRRGLKELIATFADPREDSGAKVTSLLSGRHWEKLAQECKVDPKQWAALINAQVIGTSFHEGTETLANLTFFRAAPFSTKSGSLWTEPQRAFFAEASNQFQQRVQSSELKQAQLAP